MPYTVCGSREIKKGANVGWKIYKLTYRAHSPVLLGDHPLGFIQRTRWFIPGWTMWGAITARLTRQFWQKASPTEYQQMGSFVENNILTSYAGILIDNEIALPHFKNGEWMMGAHTFQQFEARFLASGGHSAIQPGSLTAETGSLHEKEVLAAYDKKNGKPVLWGVYLYVHDEWAFGLEAQHAFQNLDWIPDEVPGLLETLFVGADIDDGLGILKQDPSAENNKQVGSSSLEWPRPEDWKPWVEKDKQYGILCAHVPMKELESNDLSVYGQWETITRRIWRNVNDTKGWGPGQQIETQCYCCPGSITVSAGWQPVVGPKGIWMKEKEHNVSIA